MVSDAVASVIWMTLGVLITLFVFGLIIYFVIDEWRAAGRPDEAPPASACDSSDDPAQSH